MREHKFNHYRLIWLYSMIVTTIVILIFMTVSGCTPFGSYSLLNYDAFHQFMAFCSELRRKILSGESLFYSWNIGMGMNFMAVFAVILNSPFNILLLLFSNEDICISVTLIIVLKIIASSGAMAYFLTERAKDDPDSSRGAGKALLIIALSLAYATCGYVCGYYWNFMWLDVILILPLIVLGMDRLIYKGKPVLYIVALFYSINCSYYLSIMVCMFLVLYFFTYKYESAGDFLKKGIRFAGASILAAGMASLIIIVAYKNIIYSNTSKDSMPDFGWFGNIFYMLKSHYFLSVPIISQPEDGDANLYCGVMCVITLLFYPFVKKISRRERITKTFIVVFLLISMNSTVLNYIWHGLHDQKGVPNRFSFIYTFMLIMIAYDTIVALKKENLKRFVASGIIAAMLPIVIYFFNDYNGFVSSKSMLLIALFMSFVYVVVLFVQMYNEKTYLITTFVIAGLIGIEAAIAAVVSLKDNDLNDTGYYMTYIVSRYPAIDSVREQEQSLFYREEIADNVVDNESIYHGMKGYSLFSSVVSSDMEMTMRNLGIKNSDISFNYTSNNQFIDDVYGIKYLYSLYDDAELETYCDKIYDNNGVVYLNRDALPVGFGVSKELKNLDISKTGNAAYNQSKFAEYASGVEGLYDIVTPPVELYSQDFELVWDADNSTIRIGSAIANEIATLSELYINYTIEEEGDYYFNSDFHYLYAVNIAVNQNLLSENENANQMIHIGNLNPGDTLTIQIQIPLQFLDSVPVYLSKYNKDKEEEAVSRLSQNGLNVTACSGSTLEGDVTLEDDQMLFLSIPYDNGWTAYVDGKETDIIKLFGTFSGIDMGAGSHHVELKFVSEGFYAGFICTIVSWCAFIGLLIVLKRRKRVNVSAEADVE